MIKTRKQTQKNQIKFYSILPSFSVFRIGIFLLTAIICGVGVAQSQPNQLRPNTPNSSRTVGTPATSTPASPSTGATTATTSTAADPAVSPEVKAGLDNAVKAFNESKINDVLTILKELYAKNPEIAPPRVVMAQMFAQTKLGEAVLGNLELGTEETPNDPEAYLLLGEIALRQRSLTAAELLLKRAAELVNNYSANETRKKNLTSSILRVLSDLYEARQRWEQMEKSVDKQIQFDGVNTTLLRRKGIAVFRQNRTDEAKQLFLKADQLDQTNKEVEQKGLPADAAMSQLYLITGDKDNARKSLETALKTYPQSKEVLALSVQMKVSDDKLEEAMPLAQKLLSDDPTSIPAKRLCATVALYLKNYALAEKLFQDLLLDSPTDASAQNGLALALCEQDTGEKLKRALEYAVDNVRKNQNNGEFWGTLGWIQYKANLLEDAVKSLRQAAATGSINAATAYYSAQLAVKNNKNDEAKQLLTRALQGNNQFAKRRDAALLLETLSK
jgi:tetratricopeptide (TPR) repeat protein